MRIIRPLLITTAIGGAVFLLLVRIWILGVFATRFFLDRQIMNQHEACAQVKLALRDVMHDVSSSNNPDNGQIVRDLKQESESCQKVSWQDMALNVIRSPVYMFFIPFLLSSLIGYWFARKFILR
jgi:hypothetical protein